jgi:hypothetical protein
LWLAEPNPLIRPCCAAPARSLQHRRLIVHSIICQTQNCSRRVRSAVAGVTAGKGCSRPWSEARDDGRRRSACLLLEIYLPRNTETVVRSAKRNTRFLFRRSCSHAARAYLGDPRIAFANNFRYYPACVAPLTLASHDNASSFGQTALPGHDSYPACVAAPYAGVHDKATT